MAQVALRGPCNKAHLVEYIQTGTRRAFSGDLSYPRMQGMSLGVTAAIAQFLQIEYHRFVSGRGGTSSAGKYQARVRRIDKAGSALLASGGVDSQRC